jgi:hypothetical protein
MCKDCAGTGLVDFYHPEFGHGQNICDCEAGDEILAKQEDDAERRAGC